MFLYAPTIDIDDCADVVCQNGGTCVDECNGYSCTCVDGYDGDNCENGMNHS